MMYILCRRGKGASLAFYVIAVVYPRQNKNTLYMVADLFW